MYKVYIFLVSKWFEFIIDSCQAYCMQHKGQRHHSLKIDPHLFLVNFKITWHWSFLFRSCVLIRILWNVTNGKTPKGRVWMWQCPASRRSWWRMHQLWKRILDRWWKGFRQTKSISWIKVLPVAYNIIISIISCNLFGIAEPRVTSFIHFC